MPRFKTHLLIGAATGAAYSLAKQTSRQNPHMECSLEICPVHIAASAAAAAIGSCIPDMVEPANRKTGPNHRGSLHSFLSMAIGIKTTHFLATCETESTPMRWVADLAGAFCAGYASHLAADAFTPKGLSLICKGF
ncbi:membrane-bound metal-dependent hydrolase YbcI (DUF457 family) [Ereboglobus sp. PH5-5]|uniref:metal-dependent hydrolase n=1 Tax=Ereboglobus sp. PH5-5 TaxID=2940529 RepID=UPI002406A681|nr:metal-dependent hydrolase [Ereboglobus sp. PH5-5]MDF9832360.1 membrane-bound metal-dependent hydrolase YbcI (DUF457 family) [Ereboglobus sp. PH5-5]